MPGPLSETVTRKRGAWLGGGGGGPAAPPRPPGGADREGDDALREDARFLGGVERVVDGFLDAGEERLSRVVEAEQVAVLGEELGHRDVPLAGAHLDGGYGRFRPGGRGPGECGYHRLL